MTDLFGKEAAEVQESVSVAYFLENKERIFDLGQGIYANRSYIFRKRGGSVPPYTGMLRKMIGQMLAFFALSALQGGLMLAGDVTTIKVLLTLLTAFFGCAMLLAARIGSKAYQKALQTYYERNPGQGGTLTFDAGGITECSDHSETLEFQWNEYEACVICPDAIVILSTRPVMIICSRTGETEQAIRSVMGAAGKEHTVYEVKIKERRK